jgi:hypothetical protein
MPKQQILKNQQKKRLQRKRQRKRLQHLLQRQHGAMMKILGLTIR